MPTRDQVFRCCDHLLARGERVSLDTVRKVLPRGGSNRDVGPFLAEWKAERRYMPRLVVNDLPERVQAELVAFARSVFEAAKETEAGRLEGERERLEAGRAANDEVVNEAMARLDAMEADNARLRREAEALADANARLRGRLDRIRAEEFWDRVMLEVAALMPPGGTVPLEDILAGLKPSIYRGARLHREPLDAATLRKKMAARAWHGRYFEEGPDGVLVRKAG